ncbi:MAG: hypothetical protein AAB552_01330 [Patescibacteria group bacterium]
MNADLLRWTNYLITRNNYDRIWRNLDVDSDEFLTYLTDHLLYVDDELTKMSQETLEEIINAFEENPTLADKKELFTSANVSRTYGNMLRGTVVLCLASVIRDRLDPIIAHEKNIPPYLTIEAERAQK